MVFRRETFLMLLHSLLCISSSSSSSVSFLDTRNYQPIKNHDCYCSGNNLGQVDSPGSWTPKLSTKQSLFERGQEAFTGVLLVIILLNILVYKIRKLHETSLGENRRPPSLSEEHLCRRFLFSEMQLATNSFDESMIIGKGGFGKVYRGFIDDGATMVAIKRSDSRSKQGANEFWTEIKLLSRFRHGHLVSLIGYCDELDEMMVVYEYISGGNLAERLYKLDRSSQKLPLSWADRLKICIGAARALDYLHTGTGVHHHIIHRDVKSSNILLDENNTAKVSDFGVSKVSPADQGCTHVSTDVKGSFGYFDPSYILTRRLTRKSDVYSFGVVLLEVLCGRPAVDPSLGEDDLGLVGWAKQFIREGTSNHIIDPSLMGLTPCSRVKAQIMPDCLKAFLEIADKCLQTRPKDRPTMGEVVLALEAVLALQERGDSLVASGRYDNNSNSFMKSGKIISLSRTLRSMLLVKRPVMGDIDSLGKKKRQNELFLPCNLPAESGNTFQDVKAADSGLKKFNLDVLKKASRNFSDDTVVGEGAFGKVYMAWFEQETYVPSKPGSGIPVAVKKLNTDGYQGLEEWQMEVKLLGELSHPNLIKLLGYCSEDRDLLLVYEFMHKGNLESYILKPKGLGRTLSWSMRVKIMIGTAKGIAFLHNRENKIINRDVKTSNILLDQDFNAKIADLGLARRGPISGETHLITQVMGTYGYAAPEYVATGYLNGKNDIYAFGVVLLEALTGLRVFDKTRAKNEQDLVQWVRPMLPKKKKLMTIVDPSLGDDYPQEAIYKCAKLILKCTQSEPKDRPSIEQVLQSLERISCIKK